MSWYKISYVCGHEGREQIYGKTSEERQRMADWRGNNKVCRDCWIAGRAEGDRRAARCAFRSLGSGPQIMEKASNKKGGKK